MSPLRPFVKKDPVVSGNDITDYMPDGFQEGRRLIEGEPVVIQITRLHAYKKGTRGCKHCNQRKYHPDHLGHSESVNAILGGSHFVYQGMFDGWSEALTAALLETPLPRPCAGILAEGVMCFPQQYANGPDQGNHRFIVEKALGDALQGNRLPECDFCKGTGYVNDDGDSCAKKDPDSKKCEPCAASGKKDKPWLLDDDWPSYQFGNLDYDMQPGQSWTKIILFPR
jgi:hypothetical protein